MDPTELAPNPSDHIREIDGEAMAGVVVMYQIAGRQIGSHWLAIATLATVGGLSTLAMGGSSAKKSQGPPINAQSPDEEKFIREFMQNAEAEEKKASHGNNADMSKKDAGR